MCPRWWIALVAAVVSASCLPNAARAQWSTYGVALSDTCCPLNEPDHAVSDGKGGLLAVWMDSRDPNDGEPYAQHLTAAGTLAPGWSPSALKIVTGQFPGDWPDQAISDGAGGLFVSMSGGPPATFSDITLQHILPDGTLPAGWPAWGVKVAATADDEEGSSICRDADGGVFVFYYVNLAILRAQHITAQGTVAPGWPSAGIDVAPVVGNFEYLPTAVADSSGGAIVVWEDSRYAVYPTLDNDLFAQRVRADGTIASGWPITGLPICLAPHMQTFHHVVSDGAGGAFIAWSDFRDAPPEVYYGSAIYLTRLLPGGTIAPGWPVNGRLVFEQPGSTNTTQRLSDLAPDGDGGALLAWENAWDASVYVQRILADGTVAPGWPSAGKKVSTLVDYLYDPYLCDDGAGGAYVGFTAYNHKIYMQHLTGSGQVAPGWPSEGYRALAYADSNGQYPRVCSDGHGGAILIWAGSLLNYAQRYGADGPVPVMLALVAFEALPDQVALTWGGPGAAVVRATVERRTESASWQPLGAAEIAGADRLHYLDRAVTPGTRYAYRLAWSADGGEQFTAASWVEVPRAAALFLEGLRPNPAAQLDVAFSLPSAAPATLELLDVSGRRLLVREVGSLGAGRHLLRLADRATVAAGLYWLRLRQGGRALSTRAAVVR